MRVYEELFIVKADATDEEVDPLIEQVKGVITSAGGTVEKAERWGVRKLAYRVQKRSEGLYILVQFSAGPQVAKELERRLRVSDLVLKFITVLPATSAAAVGPPVSAPGKLNGLMTSHTPYGRRME